MEDLGFKDTRFKTKFPYIEKFLLRKLNLRSNVFIEYKYKQTENESFVFQSLI
jgi:hypothetical protein